MLEVTSKQMTHTLEVRIGRELRNDVLRVAIRIGDHEKKLKLLSEKKGTIEQKKSIWRIHLLMRAKDSWRNLELPLHQGNTNPVGNNLMRILNVAAFAVSGYALRTNELLNVWTHMWRRRQMLGLSEKKILNYDIDMVASDPSDANTNNTTVFSDDTDEKSRRSTILENIILNNREAESNAAASVEPALNRPSEYHPDVLRPINKQVEVEDSRVLYRENNSFLLDLSLGTIFLLVVGRATMKQAMPSFRFQLNVENLDFNLYFTVALNALMEIPAVFVQCSLKLHGPSFASFFISFSRWSFMHFLHLLL
ncbi:hypothetical protein IFM89_032737 [Coptis chinensis]|uniref:Uncharacterized protein n=1 Tax=Coptis chinensis TaxID=261450 RepID=A0A835LKF3_9MAGN|nr:hypothetical protein IFM89_032737 [Coptis chinensis]